MIKLFRFILIMLVVVVISVISGDSCHMMKVHESGKASYIPHTMCVINSDKGTTDREWTELMKWCSDLRRVEQP